MRRPGSARFDPYYKVQWYDDRSRAWIDIQRAHPTIATARAAYVTGKTCRVMRITMKGRGPISPEATDHLYDEESA